MEYIQGTPREQLVLFSERLDGIVEENNPVRFIDEYIGKLDLKELEFKEPKIETGRPPYKPELMIKIYVYGYLHGIRSSRRLEKECRKNIELIWLCEQLAPDFKTVADFRKDNREGIKNIFKNFLEFCKKLKLIDYKLVAIDGTKMRAQNSINNIYKKKEMKKLKKKLDNRIKEYMEELDRNDEKEAVECDLTEEICEKINKLKKSKIKLKEIKKIFKKNPELDIYFGGDSDSRFQRDNGRINAGYNCQIGVDNKNKLIVAADVTNESNDKKQLNNMKKKVCEGKNRKGKTAIVADTGYYSENEVLKAVQDKRTEIYVPHPGDVKRNVKEKVKYTIDDFKYDKAQKVFVCPEGKELQKRGKVIKHKGVKKSYYICNECKGCRKKKLCTTEPSRKRLLVSEQIMKVIAFREKMNKESSKKVTRKRKELAEHPFGTLKHGLGYRHFMQKGKENACSEFTFMSFIYNLKRVLNIKPMKELIAAVN